MKPHKLSIVIACAATMLLPLLSPSMARADTMDSAPSSAALTSPEGAVSGSISIRETEKKLHELGLPIGSKVDGRNSAENRRAYCSWRELTGRNPSRNTPSQEERLAILSTQDSDLTPPRNLVTGMNVNRECQTLTWVKIDKEGNRYVRAVYPVSSGTWGHATPTGHYSINRQINGWHESTKYAGAMMYRPKYFNGGIALHGSYTDSLVLPYPASHGCVRMLHKDVDSLWRAGVGPGTPVYVYGTWSG